jgi:hypothetical protein
MIEHPSPIADAEQASGNFDAHLRMLTPNPARGPLHTTNPKEESSHPSGVMGDSPQP